MLYFFKVTISLRHVLFIATALMIAGFIFITVSAKYQKQKKAIKNTEYKVSLRTIYDAALVKADTFKVDKNSHCKHSSPFGFIMTCSLDKNNVCVPMRPPSAGNGKTEYNYSLQEAAKVSLKQKCIVNYSNAQDYGFKLDENRLHKEQSKMFYAHAEQAHFAYGFDLGDPGLTQNLQLEKFDAVEKKEIKLNNGQMHTVWQTASIWAVADLDGDYIASNSKSNAIEFPLSGSRNPDLSYYGRSVFINQKTLGAEGVPGVIKINPGE